MMQIILIVLGVIWLLVGTLAACFIDGFTEGGIKWWEKILVVVLAGPYIYVFLPIVLIANWLHI